MLSADQRMVCLYKNSSTCFLAEKLTKCCMLYSQQSEPSRELSLALAVETATADKIMLFRHLQHSMTTEDFLPLPASGPCKSYTGASMQALK